MLVAACRLLALQLLLLLVVQLPDRARATSSKVSMDDIIVKYDTAKNESEPYVSETEVVKYLFRNYSSDCRPRRDASQQIAISIGLSFYALNEIIERTHQVIATASLTVQWWDEFLTWENTPYASVKLFAYPNTKIWLPDIALTNSGDLYALMNSRGMMAVIHSNGAVEYFPEATVTTFCQFDLTYFPFDTQICDYKFESWSYILQQQTFHLASPPVNLHRYGDNEQWDLVDTNARAFNVCYIYTTTLSYCYPAATFRLLLRRKSGYYTIMIIIPSIIFSAVELVAFSLPLAEVTKLQIIFTCLLSYAVFQTTVRVDMPRTSEHDPLMSIYFDLQMGFIAFTLIGEAFVYLMQQQGFVPNRKAPNWLIKLFRIPKSDYLISARKTKEDEPLVQPEGGHASVDTPATGASENNKPSDEAGAITLQVFPIRNVLGLQTTKMEALPESDSPAAIERRKWRALAARLERITVVIYALAIIATPLFIFKILPAIFGTKLNIDEFKTK